MEVTKKFVNCYNDLMDFEDVQASSKAEDNVHALEALRVHLEYLWSQLRRSYEICRDYTPTEGEKSPDLKYLREQYRKALTAYKSCLGSINAEIETLKPLEAKLNSNLSDTMHTVVEQNPSYSLRLPPCDTDVFSGSYKEWPTFRDLFSAIYIQNSKVTKVEKLYYLKQKTEGEAREIISHIPLTHDGFEHAWNNLLDRYENKRMQVNDQIKLLFDLPSVSVDSSSSLKLLQRTVNGCLQSLKMLNIDVKSWDPLLIYLCCTKLPRNYLQDFENTLSDSSQMPSWYDFDNFLSQRFKTLESIGTILPQNSKLSHSQASNRPNIRDRNINSFQTNVSHTKSPYSHKPDIPTELQCPLCNDSHILRNCPNFLAKSINDRIHIVKTTNSCYNCLGVQHAAKDCRSKFTCRSCNKRHNTLLHKTNEQNIPYEPTNKMPTNNMETTTSKIQSTSTSTSLATNIQSYNITNKSKETLLFTALVELEVNGQRFVTRAIIDPGSQSTFVSEKLKNKLDLPTKKHLIHVAGLNPLVTEMSTKAALFKLCSRTDPTFKLDVWAPVLKTLPLSVPPHNLNLNELKKTLRHPLADPNFDISQSIDMLIGLDIGPFIYDLNTPMHLLGSLLTQKTVFGWIVGGPVEQAIIKPTIALYNNISLDRLITKFWEVEETPKTILRSEEDNFCESIFLNSTYREKSGRYVVTMPFKQNEDLGHSRNIAMAQFHRMEKMLLNKPDIKVQYDQVISEYLKLGHMKKISPFDIHKRPNFYLPHHAIVKPDRLTTKLRVVFNASCPSSNKKSLNDILHPGPVLQQDLVIQTLRWRFFKFVFNADITKMYRQILLNPSQTSFQRILFRPSTTEPIQDFELLTVTFGVNCAPFLALRTMLQLAEDVQQEYPLASKIIRDHMYVDDVLAGGHFLNDTILSREQLEKALHSAGFELRKWASNNPEIIASIPEDQLLSSDCRQLSENLGTKTLGIQWNISSDSFSFPQHSILQKSTFTKREVLSGIAKLFDPCGWLAPIIIGAKLIMQQLWLDKVDWDGEVPTSTHLSWKQFINNSYHIKDVLIPRWIHYTPESSVEIHGFCDSSERAYAATLYIRVQNENTTSTHLLIAKTRVAPIKKLSLPRLELCGAVLLSKLVSSTIPNLNLPKYDLHLWTDSSIVLSWLNKHPCTWNTFVGNRVADILDNVGKNNWHHVDSISNPADLATRGCSSLDLKENCLWWYGPAWLKSGPDHWPQSVNVIETNLEQKSQTTLITHTFEDPLNRFSSLYKAYRVLAFLFRWWRNTGQNRLHLRVSSHTLLTEEIAYVKNRLIHITQMYYFSNEYQLLYKEKNIPTSSCLLAFNPFIDKNKIIRANGRLANSPTLTYNERHPVLLPYHSRFARLLVEQIHKKTFHGGNQLMIRTIRSEYWIFKLKVLVKVVINNCTVCIINRRQTHSQIMGALPPERSTLNRPFLNTGVDYAGPFNIRSFNGRACLVTKGYVCLFVCFSTKAIHLELASDLTTQAFMAALHRFIGRRGCPANIFSDNGTNFVGAAEILKKERLEFFNQLQNLANEYYSYQTLNWKFIPPGAPHMGGLWEAGVKSFKLHLKKTLPDMKFTFEEFSTILTRIEACLNSRPLTPMSDDPHDLCPLTPGHFLIGTSLLTPAEPDKSDESISTTNRWKRIKIISQQLCLRWKSEYLKELHRRYKWKRQEQNAKLNDLVVIRDEKLPLNEWKLGRIIKLYSGTDDNNRVVDLKTNSGIIRRPITKLIPLISD